MTTPDSAAPITKLDYDHWSRMARWDMDQATALALDLDPDDLAARPHDVGPERYKKLRAIVANHVSTGRLPYLAEPAEFLAWAFANGVTVSVALLRTVEAQHGIIADWRHLNGVLRDEALERQARIEALEAECNRLCTGLAAINVVSKIAESSARTRAEASLLKMILGMAMDQYGFRADGRNSPAASKIRSALLRYGISLDEDTVRKWLRIAGEEVDHEARENAGA